MTNNNKDVQKAAEGAGIIQDLCSSYWKSCIIFAANKLHIFTKLSDKQLTKHEIARFYKADSKNMEALLNACVSLGLMDKKDDKYKNTPISNKFLVQGREYYQGNIIAHWADMMMGGQCQRLDESVLSGTPVHAIRNDSYDINNEWGFGNGLQNWVLGMHNWASAGHADLLASSIDLNGRKKLLDVGGGSGTYSIALCKKYQELESTIIDSSEILKITKSIIMQNKLENRIRTKSSDLRSGCWDSADVILLSNVLHMGDFDFYKDTLLKALNALKDKGLLIIQEWFLNSYKTSPLLTVLFSLHIITRVGGNIYSFDEMVELLKETGFSNIRIVSMPGLWSLVVAEKINAS